MVQSLTFIDCSWCGKRIRSNALRCHHCREENTPTSSNSWAQPENSQKVVSKSGNHTDDSHMALEHGGYDDADNFDYEEYVAENFPSQAERKWRVKPWIWVTAWLLICATLLPYLYYAFILTQ
jgi:hypothetical protein